MKQTSMTKIVDKIHQQIDEKVTKGQLKKALNILSMILIQDPGAQATILINGIKFEKEWNEKQGSGE